MSETWEPGYGCITFLTKEVVAIGEVPRRMKVDLGTLVEHVRQGALALDSGATVSYGRHEDGGLVWYQVIGWDPVEQVLILELDTMMREVGKHGDA